MMGSSSTSGGNYKILVLVLQGDTAMLLMGTKMAAGTGSLCVGKGWLEGHVKGGMREKG